MDRTFFSEERHISPFHISWKTVTDHGLVPIDADLSPTACEQTLLFPNTGSNQIYIYIHKYACNIEKPILFEKKC